MQDAEAVGYPYETKTRHINKQKNDNGNLFFLYFFPKRGTSIPRRIGRANGFSHLEFGEKTQQTKTENRKQKTKA